jgi:glycosyltransferase involved in cell wall biosynthesis
VQGTTHRNGAIVYGRLAPRKGLDRLAAAAAVAGPTLSLTLAGDLAPGFEDEFAGVVGRMRTTGAILTLLPSRQEESDGLTLLAAARCAVLPYVSHYGMSRVLLEAACAGTPVVASRQGLLGHLVQKFGLGASVDVRSPVAMRHAIDTLCHDDDTWQQSHLAAHAFARRYAQERFRDTLANVLTS